MTHAGTALVGVVCWSVLWAVALGSSGDKCVYTEDACSCSYHGSHVKKRCARVQSIINGAGTCTTGDCKEGYSCDCLNPTHMCVRRPCKSWVAKDASHPTSGYFSCAQQERSCMTMSHALADERSTEEDNKCIFNDKECSCRFSDTPSSSKCARLNKLTGGASTGVCVTDTCRSGFKCDCLKATHICVGCG
jgi:hypothetical protein